MRDDIDRIQGLLTRMQSVDPSSDAWRELKGAIDGIEHGRQLDIAHEARRQSLHMGLIYNHGWTGSAWSFMGGPR